MSIINQQQANMALVKETIADLLLENVLLRKQLLDLSKKIQELQKQLKVQVTQGSEP